jgi:hypothetical protein
MGPPGFSDPNFSAVAFQELQDFLRDLRAAASMCRIMVTIKFFEVM